MMIKEIFYLIILVIVCGGLAVSIFFIQKAMVNDALIQFWEVKKKELDVSNQKFWEEKSKEINEVNAQQDKRIDNLELQIHKVEQKVERLRDTTKFATKARVDTLSEAFAKFKKFVRQKLRKFKKDFKNEDKELKTEIKNLKKEVKELQTEIQNLKRRKRWL